MADEVAAGLPRTLAVINGKGGTLKTSVVASVGGLVAAAGWRVLIVDMDPQGNQSEQLGLADVTDEGAHLFEVIPTGRPLRPVSTGRDRLDIAFGGFYLNDLVGALTSRQGRDPTWMHSLATCLIGVADEYDLILIDCPPGTDVLQSLALVAARFVLIPTKSDAMSRKGMREVARLFTVIRPTNPSLELLGVLRTGTTAGASAIRAEARADIQQDLGGAAPVLETTIRHAERAAKVASDTGRLPFELEPQLEHQKPYWKQLREGHVERGLPQSTTGLAQDYAELTQEIIDLMEAADSSGELGRHIGEGRDDQAEVSA